MAFSGDESVHGVVSIDHQCVANPLRLTAINGIIFKQFKTVLLQRNLQYLSDGVWCLIRPLTIFPDQNNHL